MKDSNMYCMVSFADKNGKSHGDLGHPQILEIQGVVWFATEDLARQYYMMLKPELRDNDNVFPMLEENLPWHFDVNSSYIKHMKTRTRLTKEKGKPGVKVYTHNGAPVPMNYGQ
tara:strand:+ start:1769 stop:2110 length:342 start_codon:yes stop_codon:yes gene_type:complete